MTLHARNMWFISLSSSYFLHTLSMLSADFFIHYIVVVLLFVYVM